MFGATSYNEQPFELQLAAKAGKPLLEINGQRVVFIVVEFRNDYDQVASGLGFPYHNQIKFCFRCDCSHGNRYKFKDAHLWLDLTHEMYMDMIYKCIYMFEVNEQDLILVMNNLIFDLRKQGTHGRSCNNHLAVTDLESAELVILKKWDRLCLGGCISDIHATIGQLRPPFKFIFWRAVDGIELRFWPQLLQNTRNESRVRDYGRPAHARPWRYFRC